MLASIADRYVNGWMDVGHCVLLYCTLVFWDPHTAQTNENVFGTTCCETVPTSLCGLHAVIPVEERRPKVILYFHLNN